MFVIRVKVPFAWLTSVGISFFVRQISMCVSTRPYGTTCLVGLSFAFDCKLGVKMKTIIASGKLLVTLDHVLIR